MATVSVSDDREVIARQLAEAIDGKLHIATTESYDPDDPGTRGNLLCAYCVNDADFAYVDVRKGDPEAQLASELRRIGREYLKLARKLESKRPLTIKESIAWDAVRAERCAVVLEHDDRREVVYVASAALCQQWVERWYEGDTCGVDAVALPIVESLAGHKFNSLLQSAIVEPTGDGKGGVN